MANKRKALRKREVEDRQSIDEFLANASVYDPEDDRIPPRLAWPIFSLDDRTEEPTNIRWRHEIVDAETEVILRWFGSLKGEARDEALKHAAGGLEQLQLRAIAAVGSWPPADSAEVPEKLKFIQRRLSRLPGLDGFAYRSLELEAGDIERLSRRSAGNPLRVLGWFTVRAGALGESKRSLAWMLMTPEKVSLAPLIDKFRATQKKQDRKGQRSE